VSDESSETTGDKAFNVQITDIDGNIRHNHTARYSEEFVALKGLGDQQLILRTIEELHRRIAKEFGITAAQLQGNGTTTATQAKAKAAGQWEDHKIENSSNLSSARYNEAEGLLDVTFQNGTEYRYKGVPATTFEDLKKTESAGKFLNQVIKGKFEYEKLEDDGE